MAMGGGGGRNPNSCGNAGTGADKRPQKPSISSGDKCSHPVRLKLQWMRRAF